MGPRPGREHLHHLLGRLPHARAVEPQRDPPLPGRRRRPGELGLAVRPGPLRVRLGQQRRAPRRAARPRRATRSREVPWGEALSDGRRRPARPPRADKVARARRRPPHQRERLRLGQARQGRPRHRPRRRPARRRAPAEVVLGLPARHDRRGLRAGRHRAAPRARPEGGAARPLPPAPPRRRPRRRARSSSWPPSARRSPTSPPPRCCTGPAPPARSCGRCSPARPARRSAASSPTPSPRPARCSPTGRSRSCSAGPTSPSRADGVVAAAAGDPRRPPRGAVPQRAAARQRARRARHGPGARAAPRPRRRSTTARAWFKGRGWPTVPDRARASTPPASSQAAAGGKIDVLVLLGADPLADFPDTDLATPGAGRRRAR